MTDQRNNTELPLAIRRDIAAFAVKLRRDYRPVLDLMRSTGNGPGTF
jgi:hypothetical protein